MIQLYISLTQKLAEIPELKLIDIDGTEEGKQFPAAFVKIGKLNYQQQQGGATYSEVPITVNIEMNPIHRSGSNSPVLNELVDKMGVIDAIKVKLINEPIDYISGIMLTGEDLIKDKGKYKAVLEFMGYVEFTPEPEA
jgi:hypothetical protein